LREKGTKREKKFGDLKRRDRKFLDRENPFFF